MSIEKPTRYVLEGIWRGYRSSMDRPVHREIVQPSQKKFLEWLRNTFCIHYPDGTTLELHLRPAKPREKVKEINGYRTLIMDCFYHNVSSVDELQGIAKEPK